MLNQVIELRNALTVEANRNEIGNFPIDVFPEKIRSILLDWYIKECYVVDFAATAMISAIATAIGTTHYLRVRENWITNASLYFILIGRPGLGKTPPLMAAFRPLRDIDSKRAEQYKVEKAKYMQLPKEEKNDSESPVLLQTCVGDFTPEALLRAHDVNRRGIVILVDEIMGMFNTVDRYSNGNLIELLLSSYSGEQIIVNRVSSDPIIISNPCINLIGTTQPGLVKNLFAKGYKENGMLDRIMFVYPQNHKIPLWTDSGEKPSSNAMTAWKNIIDKIHSKLILKLDGSVVNSDILEMSPEARKAFFGWRNTMIAEVNSVEDDTQVETRKLKSPLMVARLALILQTMRWVCDESHLEHVDVDSIHGAIRLCDYFEESYKRVEGLLPECAAVSRDDQFYSELSSEYTTTDLIELGANFGLEKRATNDLNNRLIQRGLVKRIKKGFYEKVHTSTECNICTTCTTEPQEQKKQEVQIIPAAQSESWEGTVSHE